MARAIEIWMSVPTMAWLMPPTVSGSSGPLNSMVCTKKLRWVSDSDAAAEGVDHDEDQRAEQQDARAGEQDRGEPVGGLLAVGVERDQQDVQAEEPEERHDHPADRAGQRGEPAEQQARQRDGSRSTADQLEPLASRSCRGRRVAGRRARQPSMLMRGPTRGR